mmetsp:Transcript_18707/g.74678  ORF Transcript_18707/g.74678 Transcript_18707/m.74678 type:complete len:279 (+) Transcript_18707:300-1136(+)
MWAKSGRRSWSAAQLAARRVATSSSKRLGILGRTAPCTTSARCAATPSVAYGLPASARISHAATAHEYTSAAAPYGSHRPTSGAMYRSDPVSPVSWYVWRQRGVVSSRCRHTAKPKSSSLSVPEGMERPKLSGFRSRWSTTKPGSASRWRYASAAASSVTRRNRFWAGHRRSTSALTVLLVPAASSSRRSALATVTSTHSSMTHGKRSSGVVPTATKRMTCGWSSRASRLTSRWNARNSVASLASSARSTLMATALFVRGDARGEATRGDDEARGSQR